MTKKKVVATTKRRKHFNLHKPQEETLVAQGFFFVILYL